VKRLIARAFLKITGWSAQGEPPVARRCVLIAAPHTSNWDFFYLLAFAWLYGVRIQWMGKQQLFAWPFGGVMRLLGGVAVQRDRRSDLVAQMARVIDESESICLVVPAEGTRRYVPHWKSGFYHIARTAEVPIVLSYLDYTRRVGGFGPAIIPTGDVRADMEEIRNFYAGKQGKFPELFGDVRLKEEM
jgi:1-acyl-sn-glycerol-3-phosphate acyltransferase